MEEERGSMMTYAKKDEVKKLEPHIVEAFKIFGFDEAEITKGCWDLVRNGKRVAWIALHKFLERVAQRADIVFDEPKVMNCTEKEIAIYVNGRVKDKSAWSIGEASVVNCKNDYRWAMAEKRAKDRVKLKLVGVAGDMYSEEEADEFKNEPTEEEVELRAVADDFKKEAINEKRAKTNETKKVVEKIKEGMSEQEAVEEVKKEAEEKSGEEPKEELPLDVRYKNAMIFYKVNKGKKNIANSVIDRFNKLEKDLREAGAVGYADIIKAKLNEFVGFEDEIKY
jgi:hypothetical protein